MNVYQFNNESVQSIAGRRLDQTIPSQTFTTIATVLACIITLRLIISTFNKITSLVPRSAVLLHYLMSLCVAAYSVSLSIELNQVDQSQPQSDFKIQLIRWCLLLNNVFLLLGPFHLSLLQKGAKFSLNRYFKVILFSGQALFCAFNGYNLFILMADFDLSSFSQLLFCSCVTACYMVPCIISLQWMWCHYWLAEFNERHSSQLEYTLRSEECQHGYFEQCESCHVLFIGVNQQGGNRRRFYILVTSVVVVLLGQLGYFMYFDYVNVAKGIYSVAAMITFIVCNVVYLMSLVGFGVYFYLNMARGVASDASQYNMADIETDRYAASVKESQIFVEVQEGKSGATKGHDKKSNIIKSSEIMESQSQASIFQSNNANDQTTDIAKADHAASNGMINTLTTLDGMYAKKLKKNMTGLSTATDEILAVEIVEDKDAQIQKRVAQQSNSISGMKTELPAIQSFGALDVFHTIGNSNLDAVRQDAGIKSAEPTTGAAQSSLTPQQPEKPRQPSEPVRPEGGRKESGFQRPKIVQPKPDVKRLSLVLQQTGKLDSFSEPKLPSPGQQKKDANKNQLGQQSSQVSSGSEKSIVNANTLTPPANRPSASQVYPSANTAAPSSPKVKAPPPPLPPKKKNAGNTSVASLAAAQLQDSAPSSKLGLPVQNVGMDFEKKLSLKPEQSSTMKRKPSSLFADDDDDDDQNNDNQEADNGKQRQFRDRRQSSDGLFSGIKKASNESLDQNRMSFEIAIPVPTLNRSQRKMIFSLDDIQSVVSWLQSRNGINCSSDVLPHADKYKSSDEYFSAVVAILRKLSEPLFCHLVLFLMLRVTSGKPMSAYQRMVFAQTPDKLQQSDAGKYGDEKVAGEFKQLFKAAFPNAPPQCTEWNDKFIMPDDAEKLFVTLQYLKNNTI
ncbi:hypothetical protein MIR68_006669 [Amoeboaphelidium protococcarum]|nr:hypothetical protein MIR68_006669 [Amoeboaphelidium protococcarum]